MSAMIARTCDSQAMHASDGSSWLGEKLILTSFYFGFTSFGKKLSFQILKLTILALAAYEVTTTTSAHYLSP